MPSLRVLWLAENPCCSPNPHRYRMTVLRTLPGLQKLDNEAVGEDELAQAKEEGDFLLPPSASVGNGCHPTPAVATDTESDLLNFSMEETNKIREQLGMKPLPRNKFSSFASPKQTGSGTWKREGDNVVSAILLQELDRDGLQAVHQTAGDMLQVLQQNELQGETQEEASA